VPLVGRRMRALGVDGGTGRCNVALHANREVGGSGESVEGKQKNLNTKSSKFFGQSWYISYGDAKQPNSCRVTGFLGRCRYRRVKQCTGQEVRRGGRGQRAADEDDNCVPCGQAHGAHGVGGDTDRANVAPSAFEARGIEASVWGGGGEGSEASTPWRGSVEV